MKKLAIGLACCLSASWALAAPSVDIDVLEYVIEGNTVLPPDVVEKTVTPFMGPGKSFKDIEAAREALEKAYQDAGYLSVVVSVPDQKVESGEVRLEVTEAKVDRLNITGSQYHLPSKIREKVPSLAPGQTPYFPQVQQELAQVQSGDVQVTPLIGAGVEPDKIQVDLKVQDSLPWHASFEINNNQSFNTTEGRASAFVSYDNLFQLGHRMSLGWQFAPQRLSDANTLSLSYALPLSSKDDLSLSLTNSKSDTPTGAGSFGSTITRGTFYGVRWQRELDPLNWPVRHNLYAGFDYKNNRDRTQLSDDADTQKPPLRYGALVLGYDLTWLGEDRTVRVSTDVVASNHAVAGRDVDCDGRQLDQFECKRAGASPDFLVWKSAVDYKGPLWGRWRLNASAEAQFSTGPLASGEQYSLGGAESVRGYYDYEQSGDWGWSTRLEAVTPSWLSSKTWNATGLAFFDRGFVLLREPQPGQIERVHLGSYGLGLRVSDGHGLQLSADAAMPIFETKRPVDNGDGYEPSTRRKVRWSVSLRQLF